MQPRHNPFGILMYHRIAPRIPAAPAPTWNVTPVRFREQLAGIVVAGVSGVAAAAGAGMPPHGRAHSATRIRRHLRRRLRERVSNAWPILKELSIPATVFVATAYLDADGAVSV